MRRWENVMFDGKTDADVKQEKLQDMWDDDYWAEWTAVEEDEHDHEGHHHH
jgi:hypothetical protein